MAASCIARHILRSSPRPSHLIQSQARPCIAQTRHVQLSVRTWFAGNTCGLTQTKGCQARTAPRSARFTVYSEVSVAERVRILAKSVLRDAPRTCHVTERLSRSVPRANEFVPLQKKELKDAKKAVEQLILSRHCNPIVVRLAWHDSGSYDKVCRRVVLCIRALLQHAMVFVAHEAQHSLRRLSRSGRRGAVQTAASASIPRSSTTPMLVRAGFQVACTAGTCRQALSRCHACAGLHETTLPQTVSHHMPPVSRLASGFPKLIYRRSSCRSDGCAGAAEGHRRPAQGRVVC